MNNEIFIYQLIMRNNQPTSCGKSLNREEGVKNLSCLSEASYIDFSRPNVKFNERSARSLDFWFFLSRKRTISG